MLTAGVPVFRLPRELVMAEIDAILSLGVELKCNQRLGRDFTIAGLREQGYKAIFLGVGLAEGPQVRPARLRIWMVSMTAWIFCAHSTKAIRCLWAGKSW